MAAAPDRESWRPEAILGQLVVLRRHRPDNLRAFTRWYADPEIARLTRYQQAPLSTEEVQRFFYHITIGENDAWGKGYGTEATDLMLAHAFTRLALHRVALMVFEFNPRAIRSYEKCGFVVEGRARQAIVRDGRFWDEIHMSVLAEEWEARFRDRR